LFVVYSDDRHHQRLRHQLTQTINTVAAAADNDDDDDASLSSTLYGWLYALLALRRIGLHTGVKSLLVCK